MPHFSTDDYHKLLQKIAVLETKINRLEANVDRNGRCGNETTSCDQNHNTQLITIDQEDYGSSNASSSDSLGAKPKSSHWNMGGQVTSRAQHPEICDETGWPKLSSTPVQRKKQPWIAAKGGPKIKNNLPPQQPSLSLHNRFAPLLRNPGSSSPHSRDKRQEEIKHHGLDRETPRAPPSTKSFGSSQKEESVLLLPPLSLEDPPCSSKEEESLLPVCPPTEEDMPCQTSPIASSSLGTPSPSSSLLDFPAELRELENAGVRLSGTPLHHSSHRTVLRPKSTKQQRAPPPPPRQGVLQHPLPQRDKSTGLTVRNTSFSISSC
ncbi:uncharacterized protein LOC118313818 [Xyrichtys novacula]|uniref:Uncharacterized protein LOC118313818 n=1 Tax=Xyrichtys novacula TaxID=13765 RepID=A0AAV1G0T8_XYRNO|nr:uncharacterized protein LOC118313818 [Xyrichtys novacula]